LTIVSLFQPLIKDITFFVTYIKSKQLLSNYDLTSTNELMIAILHDSAKDTRDVKEMA
jgi:hypothetical protein